MIEATENVVVCPINSVVVIIFYFRPGGLVVNYFRSPIPLLWR